MDHALLIYFPYCIKYQAKQPHREIKLIQNNPKWKWTKEVNRAVYSSVPNFTQFLSVGQHLPTVHSYSTHSACSWTLVLWGRKWNVWGKAAWCSLQAAVACSHCLSAQLLSGRISDIFRDVPLTAQVEFFRGSLGGLINKVYVTSKDCNQK